MFNKTYKGKSMNRSIFFGIGLFFCMSVVAMESNQVKALKESSALSQKIVLKTIFDRVGGAPTQAVIDQKRNQWITGCIEDSDVADDSLGTYDFNGNQTAKLSGPINETRTLCRLPIDDNTLVSSGLNGKLIQWDLTNNALVKEIDLKKAIWMVLPLGKNSEGQQLVAAGGGYNWPMIDNPDTIVTICNLETGATIECVGHTDPVWRLIKVSEKAFASSSKWFTKSNNAGKFDGYRYETRVWDFNGKQLLKTPLKAGSDCLEIIILNNRSYLVTGNSSTKLKAKNGSIIFFDTTDNSFNPVAAQTVAQEAVTVIRFTHDKSKMIIGGQDNQIIIYDITKFPEITELVTCNGHQSTINDIQLMGLAPGRRRRAAAGA